MQVILCPALSHLAIDMRNESIDLSLTVSRLFDDDFGSLQAIFMEKESDDASISCNDSMQRFGLKFLEVDCYHRRSSFWCL
ncbi:hypothetical protein COCNU_contig69388085G000010 [Cocos nucifera]|nr:hypothetical protein [Cocos nucifera]